MAEVGSDKTSNKLALARAYVKLQAPYFGATLYGLIPRPYVGLTEIAGGPLAVTERLVLLYEPDWLNEISVLVLATGLGHECLHALLHHINRGKSYADPERYNRAADLFINGTMVKQMRSIRTKDNGNQVIKQAPLWEFPDWALMPSQYGFEDGLTADAYYHLLEKHEAKEHQKQAAGSNGAGKPGQGLGSSSSSPQPGEKPNQGKIMAGCCGGVSGNPLRKELEKSEDNRIGHSETQCHKFARDTAAAIKAHMEGEGRGTMPGSWSEIVEISDTVFHVPWVAKLGRATRSLVGNIQRGGLDYSMRRPSKRSTLVGFPRPGLIAYEPTIWIVVDSSASMGKQNLGDALRVCVDVMRQTGVMNVWYMEADTKVQTPPTRVSIRDLQHMEIKGRGGTDFCPAFEMAEQARPKPDAVIYLSDGDGTAPEEQPRGINVIWGIVPGSRRRAPADWGETIFLDDVA